MLYEITNLEIDRMAYEFGRIVILDSGRKSVIYYQLVRRNQLLREVNNFNIVRISAIFNGNRRTS